MDSRCKLKKSGQGSKLLKGENLRGAEKVRGWLRKPEVGLLAGLKTTCHGQGGSLKESRQDKRNIW